MLAFSCTSLVANQPRRLDGAAAFLAAIFADAVNLEVVPRGVEVVFAPNLFFQLVHFGRKELDRRVTLGADHVMVVAAVELMLITCHAVWKRDSAGQPAFRQQLERAVNRGEADFGIFLAHQAEKFVCGEMVARFKKGAQDGVTLVSMLEPNAL
jgi:hypothetical protein